MLQLKTNFICVVVLCLLSSALGLAQEASSSTELVITKNTTLDPGKVYGRLVITASDLVIDGQGAWVVGGDAAANKRTGTAIEARGVQRVTLKNLRVRGWETGLRLTDCAQWTVEDCDFSDNFHDPEFGWGENGRRGGIVLLSTTGSILRRNQAHRVWDACVLVDSHANTLDKNNFSHTSNTGLKLWQSSGNTFTNNNFSYGIRKKPEEVHARDSTGVLIESGSNDNRFVNNDCTYGGDGIFIRVLNRWCSTNNYFEGNDCSYANNNGFECWAPRNTFVRNKANHCSYGFWLGGSDQTVLDGNEASHNGLPSGNHNSPHLPNQGHAGIVFMFGPSSHIIAHGNRCENNFGAGIALIGDLESKGRKWKAHHWLIEQNHLSGNRWGVYAQYADWIHLSGNYIANNQVASVVAETDVSRLTEEDSREKPWSSTPERLPTLKIDVPGHVRVGEAVHFHVSGLAMAQPRIEWDLGDGQSRIGADVQHVFTAAGFYRVGVSARGGSQAQIGWFDLYVTDNSPELASAPSLWSFEAADGLKCTFTRDTAERLVGDDSIAIRVNPYHGGLVRMQASFDKLISTAHCSDRPRLVFWLKSINPNLPGWQFNNPEVVLVGEKQERLTLKPRQDLLSHPSNNEARDGWQLIEVPLAANAQWDMQGSLPAQIASISIGVDSWDAGPLQLWIDGLSLQP